MTASASVLLRIGAAAEAAGLSTRTLRYWEQRGLLSPSAHSEGGERRYSSTDVERLRHIRELADLLGADLEEIRIVLAAEDRLASLRAEWHGGVASRRRREEILAAGLAERAALLARVDARIVGLQDLRATLQARIAHVEDLRASLSEDVPVR